MRIQNRTIPLVVLCVVGVALIGLNAYAAKPDPGTRLLVIEDNGPAHLSLHGAAPDVEIPGEGVSIGLRSRYITIPDALFGVYLKDHTSFHSYAVGLEVGIDGPAGSRIIFGLDYSDFSMPGGNFRQIDELPDEASYTEVNLHLITLEALFLWKYAFVEQFGLIYGAGLGISYTPGDITSTDVMMVGPGFQVCSAGKTQPGLPCAELCSPQLASPAPEHAFSKGRSNVDGKMA